MFDDRQTSDPGHADPSRTGPEPDRAQSAVQPFITLSGSCTFCGETGITFPHRCDPCRERLLDEGVNEPHRPTSCSIANCPLCFGHLQGENPGSDTIYFRDPYETQDSVPPPNHFDLYEALDRIKSDLSSNQAKADLYALRAYITGMEK